MGIPNEWSLFIMAKYLGSSIISFTENAAWGGGEVTCDINLIDCAVEGDMFSPPTIGTPSLFSYESHSFFGIIDRYTRSDSTSGYPQYTVHLTNGVFLLQGTKLILNDYYGVSNGIPNLINVFGYLENTGGFGASEVNDAGISWSMINSAVNTLANNSTGTSYGGCIKHKTFKYGIDLSLLPAIPNYYRINNNSISLLEFIQEVCEAGGHDFLIKLEYLNPTQQALTGLNAKFKVYTVSRLNEPTPGAIESYVDSISCVVSKEVGQEIRKDANSKFVVGGPVDRMWFVTPTASGNGITGGITQSEYSGYTVLPYLGNDVDGNYIVGYTYEVEPDEYYFDIDIKDLGHDLLGETYTCSTSELRAAKIGRESWERFIAERSCNKYIKLDASYCGTINPTAKPYVIPMPTSVISQNVYGFNPAGEYGFDGEYYYEGILKYSFRYIRAKHRGVTGLDVFSPGRPNPYPDGLTPSTYYWDYDGNAGSYPPDSFIHTSCDVNLATGKGPAAFGKLLPILYYPATDVLNPYFGRAFALRTPAPNAIMLARMLESDDYYLSVNADPAHLEFFGGMYENFKVSMVDQYISNLAGKLSGKVAAPTYVESEYSKKCTTLYKKIKDLADNYYGKRFMVLVPTTYGAIEPESTKLRLSQEPTDTGFIDSTEWDDAYATGLIPEISGLNILLSPEDKFYPFIKIESALIYDTGGLPYSIPYEYSDISINEKVIGTPVTTGDLVSYDLWVKCGVMDKLVYADNTTLYLPRAIVELPNNIDYTVTTNISSVSALRTLLVNYAQGPGGAFASDPAFTETALKKLLNNVGIDVAALQEAGIPKTPDLFAVPLRSNVLCYGPWYSAGANGPVEYEKNDDLVPWNYGGYTGLNLAGNARVNDGITNQTFDETGSLTVPGAPTFSIGDQLIAGGPYITDMEIRAGSDGVQTVYHFQTWSSQRRLAKLTNFNTERIKRLNQVSRDLSRAFREGYGNNLWKSPVDFFKDIRGKFINLEEYPRRQKNTTSHNIIGAEVNGSNCKVVFQPIYNTSTQLDDSYNDKAFMSLDGIFRPYSNFDHDRMSHLTMPVNTGDILTSYDLFPLRVGNNIGVLTGSSGDQPTYDMAEGMSDKVEVNTIGVPNYRGIAHATPQVLSGWGRDVNGDPVPLMVDVSGNPVLDASGNKQWATDYLYNYASHKTGPAANVWDEDKGVWTFNNIYIGVAASNFAAASGILQPATGEIYNYVPDIAGATGELGRRSTGYVFESSVGAISSGTIIYYYNVGNINHIIFAGCDVDSQALNLLNIRTSG